MSINFCKAMYLSIHCKSAHNDNALNCRKRSLQRESKVKVHVDKEQARAEVLEPTHCWCKQQILFMYLQTFFLASLLLI